MIHGFDGKVAAITGAASGIGRALAVALADKGCNLALADLDIEGLGATAEAVRGVRVTTETLDVARREQVFAWAANVARDHGGCNLVFNNAGISYAAAAASCAIEQFARLMDINFWGVIHGTQAFMPLLTASGEGHIINISSLFGLIAFPGQSAYCASKFAVRGFTEALRVELELSGSPVSATCVHPGGVATNIAKRARIEPSLRDIGLSPELAESQASRALRMPPERAADIILRGVRRNARRVIVGTDAAALDVVQRLFPGSYAIALAKGAKKMSLT
jgi:short-subunit dehydrogenase